MKQTNVAYNRYSEKFLKRFEEIAVGDNVKSIGAMNGSIKVECRCGCTHVEHFLFNKAEHPSHYQKHFVELCEQHSFSAEELITFKSELG